MNSLFGKRSLYFLSSVLFVSIAIPLLLAIESLAEKFNIIHLRLLIYSYQTLVAGLWAVLTAVIAVIFVVYQVQEAKKLEDQRRLNKLRAMQGLMHDVLANMTRVLTADAERLIRLFQSLTSGEFSDYSENYRQVSLKFAYQDKKFLADIIEYAESDLVLILAPLLRNIQIFEARSESSIEYDVESLEPRQIFRLMEENANLMANMAALFRHARDTSLPINEEFLEKNTRNQILATFYVLRENEQFMSNLDLFHPLSP